MSPQQFDEEPKSLGQKHPSPVQTPAPTQAQVFSKQKSTPEPGHRSKTQEVKMERRVSMESLATKTVEKVSRQEKIKNKKPYFESFSKFF